MERNQLKYVIEIAKHENITRAAEALHVTQPSLSNQLINLEQELGISLFERARKRVYLTEAGQNFIYQAKQILNEFESLEDTMRDFATKQSGSIRIGVLPLMAPLNIGALISGFQNSNPNVKLSLYERHSSELYQGVKRGELDVCFAITNNLEDTESLYQVEVRECRPVVAINKMNPLAKQKRFSLDSFRNQRILCVSPDSLIQDFYLTALNRYQIPYDIVGTCNQILSCFALVEIDFGIALCAEATSQYCKYENVVCLPVDGIPSYNVYLVYKKNPDYHPVLQSFITYTLQHYGKESLPGSCCNGDADKGA